MAAAAELADKSAQLTLVAVEPAESLAVEQAGTELTLLAVLAPLSHRLEALVRVAVRHLPRGPPLLEVGD